MALDQSLTSDLGLTDIVRLHAELFPAKSLSETVHDETAPHGNQDIDNAAIENLVNELLAPDVSLTKREQYDW